MSRVWAIIVSFVRRPVPATILAFALMGGVLIAPFILPTWLMNPRLWEEQQARERIDRIADGVNLLGATAGLAEVCGRWDKIGDEAALEWYGRASRLTELAQRYAEKAAPGDEIIASAAVVGFAVEAAFQRENPERIWNDPEGCGPAMRDEMDDMIATWSRKLNAP